MAHPREVGHISHYIAVNSHTSHAHKQKVLRVLKEYESSEKKTPNGFAYRAIKKYQSGATCAGCEKTYFSPMGYEKHLNKCKKAQTIVPLELFRHAL